MYLSSAYPLKVSKGSRQVNLFNLRFKFGSIKSIFSTIRSAWSHVVGSGRVSVFMQSCTCVEPINYAY